VAAPRARTSRIAALLALAALLGGAACSDDDGGGAATDQATPTSTVERPEGPAADVSEELEGGNGVFVGSATPAPVPDGWVEDERVAAGTATSYRSEGDYPEDGRIELTEGASADYRTRVVVRRPDDGDAFNGTVVVEWLNVSGGLDAGPDYTFAADELHRGGYAWVGVSAQHIGIEGGPVAVSVRGAEGVAGRGLKGIDPERYGSLSHPGDAYTYDIFTQVARAIRTGDLLGDLEPERVLAVGESQSGFMLTTYADGVQPLTRAFDGFLIHSRGASAAPLGEPGRGIDVATTFVGGSPTRIRTDLDAPVLVLETESDVLGIIGYVRARQDDTDRFRLWEVAGTAHADRTIVGSLADSLDCGVPINDGPQRFAVRTAVRALDRWVADGEPPPEAERLAVDGDAFRRDADGIVLGGVRTPLVDVPVAALSGEPGPRGGVICLLLGSTTPLAPERLAELYPSEEAYLDAYRQATDEAIEAGFLLEEDREAVLDAAEPERLP
jgi:Alpha/beta hydrolase domain